MRWLLIKSRREFLKNKGMLFAVILIVAIGSFLSVGLSSISQSVDNYTTQYYTDNNLADITAIAPGITSEEVSKIEKVAGVKRVQTQITKDFSLANAENESIDSGETLRLSTIPPKWEINQATMTSGSLPSTEGQVLVDGDFLRAHAGELQRVFKVKDEGGKTLDFAVSGTAETPHNTIKLKDAGQLMPDAKHFGIGYVTEKAMQQLTGDFTINTVVIDVDNDNDISRVIEDIKQLHIPSIGNLEHKHENIGYVYLNTLSETDRVLSTVLPTIFLFISALIIFVSTSRTVDMQRMEIGTMKSLGISNRKIFLYFLLTPLLGVSIGTFLGGGIGFLTFKEIGAAQVNALYALPHFEISLQYWSFLPLLGVSCLVSIGALLLSISNTLRESAASILRPKVRYNKQSLILEKLKLWKYFSPNTRLAMRNLLMNKRRLLLNIISIMFSSILVFVALGYYVSLSTEVKYETEMFQTFDSRFDFGTQDYVSIQSKMKQGGLKQSYLQQTFALTKDDVHTKGMTTVVTSTENQYVHFLDERGNEIAKSDRGAILPHKLAQAYHLKQGDTLTLKFYTAEQKVKELTIQVASIAWQYNNPSIYLSDKYFAEKGYQLEPTSIVTEKGEAANVEKLLNDQGVKYKKTTHDDIVTAYMNIFNQSYPIVILFIICSLLIVVISIFTITSINIFERKRDIATLKVLGYSHKKQLWLFLSENVMCAVIAICLALLSEAFVFNAFAGAIVTEGKDLPRYLGFFPYALSASIILISVIAVSLLFVRQIKKIDMIESLKSVE